MTGEIAILSVGEGDIKLTFDKNNPAESIRAARVVRDMLRRGYALLVQTETDDGGRPVYARAKAFDEATAEYIIVDFDPFAGRAPDEESPPDEEAKAQAGLDDGPPIHDSKPSRAAPRKGTRTRRIPAASAKAVAVARTAGG